MATSKLKIALAGAFVVLLLVLYQHVVSHSTINGTHTVENASLIVESSSLDAHSNISQRLPQQLGYVLSLGYGGYQGRGCDVILSLQCWLKSFNLPMKIVEPRIQGSQFVANGKHNSAAVRTFSEIFDIDYFNAFMPGDTEYAQLSKWKDFLQYSPKNIIYVMFQTTVNKHQKGMKIDLEVKSADECNTKYSELNFLKGFCVVKAITSFLGKPAPFTAKDMKNIIFNTWQPNEVTLVLGGWSPRYTVPNPTLLNPKRCQRNFFEEGQSPFAPSTQVMEAVRKYEQLFLKPKTSVAVMIRSEHFIRSVGGLKKSGKVIKQSDLIQLIDGHLKRLVTLVNELEGRFPGGKVFVTADVGTYGSFTWGQAVNALGDRDADFYGHVADAVKKTVASFHHNFQSFQKWEESFTKATGGINDQTLIAALQRVIASRAKCLLLFGGGTFELLAFRDYLRNHPNASEQCWRWVDVRTNFKANFLQQFQGMGRLNISATADLYTNGKT